MKKLLSTIMALVMLLSLVPMAVAEEGAGTETGAVQSSSVYAVSDAAQLIWAVENHTGDTIKLVEDVTLSGPISIGSNEAKTFVLDLGGKTLKGYINFYAGDLTVQNGTVEGAIYAYTTDEDKAYNHLTIANNAVIDGDYAVVLYQKVVGAKNFGSTIDVYGTLKGNLWVMGNITTDLATAKNPCVVNIRDGAVIETGEDNVGIALNGAAKMTVGKASITSETGIEVRAGELTVNGATVVGTGVPTNVTPNGSGTTTTGAGIAVAQHTTKLPINVTINSGDISGYSALYQSNPQNNASEGKVSVAVNGGTFKAINGGTCGVCSVNDCVAINAGAFTDLASAVKYATNGAKITLAGDATGQVVIPADKTITLDLGGKMLTNSGTAILNNGTLTVDNGTIVSTKNVGICAGDNSKTTIQPGVTIEGQEGAVITGYATGATITINGGNFSAKDNAVIAGNGNKTNENKEGKPVRVNANTITINGGTFMGNIESKGYIACGIYAPWKDVITVNGGTFTVNNGIGVVCRAGQVHINGGTFICNGSAKGKVGDKNFDMDAAQALYFDDSNPSYPAYNKDTDGIFVSRGTFSADPTAFLADESLIAVPSKGGVYVVQPKEIKDGDTTTKVDVSDDGKTVTVTETENKNEGNVATRTETVTVKDNEGNVTKATETVTTEKTENGGTTTVVTEKDTLNKTETTEVTGVTAPTTASDVTLDVKNTTNVAVNKASMTALKDDNVKDVIIETKDATLKLNKDAVKTMEGNVPANSKMTLNVTVTEEKNATTTDIEKVKVEVTAKNEAGENVFPENTANTNGLINITIPYTGTATQLDLWYTTDSGSIYMGRFPVVKGFVSFDVKHFSQYDLIPVASSGSSVIKTGAGSSAASTTQTVTTDLTPGSITKVTVDGKVVDAKYYTVSGSNVTFTAEFLKTLKNGSHTVTVENATKIAKGVFTVNNPTTAVQAPTTADAGIALYAGMAIASVMGTGVVFTSRKRKNH